MYMATVDFNDANDAATGAFEHGPTDLPPRPYMGGADAQSPWKPRKNLGTIPGSALDYVSLIVNVCIPVACGRVLIASLSLE